MAMYYVRGDGSDSNSGGSPAEAFATIEKATEVTSTGDLVDVDGGDYVPELLQKTANGKLVSAA